MNLTIQRGEMLFLIGGNGSGKSTLALLLTGLYTPTSGQVLLDGVAIDASSREDYRQLFSAVFTDFHLFANIIGPNGEQPDPKVVDEWLLQLKMSDKLQIDNHIIGNLQLSQGQQKRVALLLAAAEGRDFLLLDEWAADQDPQFRRVFYRDLLPRLSAMGKTVLAISHDDSYFQHADRLLEMRQGQLRELTGSERQAASHDAVAAIG